MNYQDSTKKRKKYVIDLLEMKQRKQKISVITAYDYSTANICDRAGIDVILVGDSAGMVMLGYPNTIPVSIDEMMVFCKAVYRGAKNTLIVGDLPFGSYQTDTNQAVQSCIQFIKAGCDAVKLEGGLEMAETVRSIVDAGIPVMGHIGLKPQTSPLHEGYKLQGKTTQTALKLIQDAKALEQAGAFSVVLEMVASEVADIISNKISIPTIGIGSGAGCDGQVLVLHDLLGIYDDIKPKFVKRYAELSKIIFDAISTYSKDVKTGMFPEEKNTLHMDPEVVKELTEIINGDPAYGQQKAR
jgi:3-methyl-2-oxobutanoate hydroxymethyltransferase